MDLMKEIEDSRAQHDIGVTAHRIYEGARDDGATRLDAIGIVYSWFLAMFEQSHGDNDETD